MVYVVAILDVAMPAPSLSGREEAFRTYRIYHELILPLILSNELGWLFVILETCWAIFAGEFTDFDTLGLEIAEDVEDLLQYIGGIWYPWPSNIYMEPLGQLASYFGLENDKKKKKLQINNNSEVGLEIRKWHLSSMAIQLDVYVYIEKSFFDWDFMHAYIEAQDN